MSILKCKKGKNSLISIGQGGKLNHCYIETLGENSKVVIGNNCNLKYLHVVVYGDNSTCEIGNDVTVNALKSRISKINVGPSSSCVIEEGCLFSNGVEIYTTDFHKVLDVDGKRINENKDISIGHHTWIGLDTIILKGVQIPHGCVVGAGSLVTSREFHANELLAGRPAKVIRRNISWEK